VIIQVVKGIPDVLRAESAQLYWEAFGGKLGHVLGPDALALKFLDRTIQSDHAFVALDGKGALLGVAGFKSPEGAFVGGGLDDLRLVYGRFGCLWRSLVLSLLEQDIENQRFLMDGICVGRAARSQGVGTALLAALFDEARARNYQSVRLDVIDSNWRAKALYERQGFIPIRTAKLGLLRYIFGFAASTTMVRPL
jgi:ribosomal protein S18 acetylase RimI-like enzyme